MLKARNGYKLFNGYTTASEVSLGIYDSPDNWHEITDQEANAWEEEQERIAEENARIEKEKRLAEEARLESERNS